MQPYIHCGHWYPQAEYKLNHLRFTLELLKKYINQIRNKGQLHVLL